MIPGTFATEQFQLCGVYSKSVESTKMIKRTKVACVTKLRKVRLTEADARHFI